MFNLNHQYIRKPNLIHGNKINNYSTVPVNIHLEVILFGIYVSFCDEKRHLMMRVPLSLLVNKPFDTIFSISDIINMLYRYLIK